MMMKIFLSFFCDVSIFICIVFWANALLIPYNAFERVFSSYIIIGNEIMGIGKQKGISHN